MPGITRLILNLSIGAKLGIASGLGVLLVATMVIVQIRANAAMRDLDARMSGQQTIARDAVEAKASVPVCRSPFATFVSPIIRRTCRKAVDNLAARLKSANHYSDEMLKISKSAENRARIEKLKTRAGDYANGAQQIAAVRTEAIAAAGGGADAAAKIAKLNEEALRIAREVTLPIVSRARAAREPDRRIRQAQCGRAGGPGRPGNGYGRMGIPGHRPRHDSVADR